MVSPAFPGMFFCFAGMALLIFASITPPAWNRVDFLHATANGVTTYFGMLGECAGGACSGPSIGYDLILGGATSTDINAGSAIRALLKAMILHVIASGLAFIAFLFGLFGVICASRFMTIMMSLTAALAALGAIVVFVFDMVIWNLVKNRINDAGFNAGLGNANWFTIGAAVSLFLAFCTASCGACGRFATGRSAGEKY